jgi:hypothetical protein
MGLESDLWAVLHRGVCCGMILAWNRGRGKPDMARHRKFVSRYGPESVSTPRC